MINGSSKAIWLSVVIHLIVIYLLSSAVTTHVSYPQSDPKPIESYIYVPPKKEAQEQQAVPDDKPEPAQQETKPEEETKTEPEPVTELVEEPVGTETVTKNTTENIAEQQQSDAVPPPTNKPFSASRALNQLRALNDDLDEKMFNEVTIDRNRPNTGSPMHGQPRYVPHSVQQQSKEEKRKAATQNLGAGIQMVKGDDGICYVERDLGAVGMEGLKSVEGFSCGPNKQDKAFKEHMKKWAKKYGK